MNRDYRSDAHILREHTARAAAFLRALYVRSDYDPALLTAAQKAAVRDLLDEADEVLNFTAVSFGE